MGALDNKVAIVTGAGKGIGKHEAIALAKAGAAVTVCARTLSDVEKVASEIEGIGGKALAIACDVADKEQIKNVVNSTVEKFGTVDILVNNAQHMGWEMTPVENWTEENIDLCFDTGAKGSWHFMVACFPYMKEKGGKIINTGSMSSYTPNAGAQCLGYAMAKEAIRALTCRAAQEWGKYKINVNLISPAAVSEAFYEIFTREQIDNFAETMRIPMGFMSEDPENHIGGPLVFLASPASDYITGCTISADGGMGMIV